MSSDDPRSDIGVLLKICEGISTSLRNMRTAASLTVYIASHASVLNTKPLGRSFLGTQQAMATEFMYLSAAKLYDENRWTPVRSIPAAIKFLNNNNANLPTVSRQYLAESLVKVKALSSANAKCPTPTLTRRFAGYCSKQLQAEPSDARCIGSIVKTVCTVRHQSVAHAGFIESPLESSTEDDIDRIDEFATWFLDVVGQSYLSLHFLDKPNNSPAVKSLENLLKAAGLLDQNGIAIP